MNDEFVFTYYGKSLDDAISIVRPERKPLLENFLYDKTSILFYAPDGIGKSTLGLQASMQSTVKDSKVFGCFNVPEACKVLYFQMERTEEESFERMHHMRKGFPFDPNNFSLSVKLQGIDLQDKAYFDEALGDIQNIINEIGFKPNLIVFDPIYSMTRDGLEAAKACNAITSFFRRIQLVHKCAIIAISHANRGVRDSESGKRFGEDLYGNRFLSAFFNGVYKIQSIKEGAGTKFTLEKSSLKNLEKSFELFFEPQYYRSMVLQDGKISKSDRLMNFLKTCKMSDKEFSFGEMETESGLSTAFLRRHLSTHLSETVKEVSKAKYGKILYKFCG